MIYEKLNLKERSREKEEGSKGWEGRLAFPYGREAVLLHALLVCGGRVDDGRARDEEVHDALRALRLEEAHAVRARLDTVRNVERALALFPLPSAATILSHSLIFCSHNDCCRSR